MPDGSLLLSDDTNNIVYRIAYGAANTPRPMTEAGLPNVERLSLGAMQGSNATSKTGYFGPNPPADGKAHYDNFQLFALDSRLNLPSGFNRQALIEAMKGHVLAQGKIVGLYKRALYSSY